MSTPSQPHDLPLPALMYGTAWKEERTAACVTMALQAGFRAIDTANQRKHYHERGVGEALAPFLASHSRGELFLQSKFTYARGQDHRLPYEPQAPPAAQVHQSFESSLEHLGVTYLDSLVLHGPEHREGLSDTDWQVWRALEEIHAAGGARHLGISNASEQQLEALVAGARVPPRFLQNRCYASRAWDAAARRVCARHGVIYQGFSLLTANREVWNSRPVAAIARRLSATPAMVIFRFARALGMVPLTGTTDPAHMALDLASPALELTEADVALIEGLGR